MPNLRVITNDTEPAGKVLGEMLAGAERFYAASAFLNSDGLNLVVSDMERILSHEGSVQLVHGADFRIADPAAIDRLVDLRNRHPHFVYRVHCDWLQTTRHRFHPKVYVTTCNFTTYSAIIGSSNLTLGGMRYNSEVNVTMTGRKDENLIKNCLAAVDAIFDEPDLLEPNDKFAVLYRGLYESAKKLPAESDPPDAFRELMEEFRGLNLLDNDQDDWQPTDQLECIVKVFQEFHHEAGNLATLAMNEIVDRSISRSVGIRHPLLPPVAQTSVPSYVSHHVVDGKTKRGSKLFKRVPGRRYRLTKRGHRFRGGTAPR